MPRALGIGPALRAVESQILMASLEPTDRRFELLAATVVRYANASRALGVTADEMLAALRAQLDRGREFERAEWKPWRTKLLALAQDRYRDTERARDGERAPLQGSYPAPHPAQKAQQRS